MFKTRKNKGAKAAAAGASSSFSPKAIRNSLSTYFIRQASNKLYPNNNVHVYAYKFKKDIGAADLTKCTLLIDYETGLPCDNKCKSTIDTQVEKDRLRIVNRFILLDTNLCFCLVEKSERDKAFILGFFNIPDDDLMALLVMLDFYKMLSGEDDEKELLYLYHYVQEKTNKEEKACKHLASTLNARTFKKALELF